MPIVSPPPAPSPVLVRWNPVSMDQDDHTLTDVFYQLAYTGPNSASVPEELLQTSNSHASLALPRGLWQFRVKAISASRGEGPYSASVSKMIQ